MFVSSASDIGFPVTRGERPYFPHAEGFILSTSVISTASAVYRANPDATAASKHALRR
jgi:hypothetical protein